MGTIPEEVDGVLCWCVHPLWHLCMYDTYKYIGWCTHDVHGAQQSIAEKGTRRGVRVPVFHEGTTFLLVRPFRGRPVLPFVRNNLRGYHSGKQDGHEQCRQQHDSGPGRAEPTRHAHGRSSRGYPWNDHPECQSDGTRGVKGEKVRDGITDATYDYAEESAAALQRLCPPLHGWQFEVHGAACIRKRPHIPTHIHLSALFLLQKPGSSCVRAGR